MVDVPVARMRAQRKVVDYFVSRGAVQVNDAVLFTTKSPVERRAFDKLRDKGFVRSAGNDTWFLDFDAYQRARKRRTQLAVAAGAALGAGVATALLNRRR